MLSCSAISILTVLSTCISIDVVSSPSLTDAMKLKFSRKEPAAPAANPQCQAEELLEHAVQIPKSLKVKWILSTAVFLEYAPYFPVVFSTVIILTQQCNYPCS